MAIVSYKTTPGYAIVDTTYVNDEIIINGQVYDKTTLSPKFGKNIHAYHPSLNGASSTMSLDMSRGPYSVNVCYNSSIGLLNLTKDTTVWSLGQGLATTVFNSSVDGTLQIPINNVVTSNVEGYAIVVSNTTLKNTFYNNGSTSVGFEEAVIGDDSNYLYILSKQGNFSSAAYGTIFYARAKPGWNNATGSIIGYQTSSNYLQGTLCLASETSSHWFFVGFGNTHTSNSITNAHLYAVNKSTRALTTIASNIVVNTTNGNLQPIPSNPISSGTNTKRLYFAYASGSSPAYTITFIDYNESTLTFTSGTCTFNWTPGGGSPSTFEASAKSSLAQYTRAFTLTHSGNNYLVFGIMENSQATAENTAAFKLYVFRIQSNFTTLDFHSVYNLTPEGRVRFITPLDNTMKKLAIIRDGSVELLQFTEIGGLGTFTRQSLIPWSSVNGSLVYDSLNRLWLVDGTTDAINVFSDSVAATIQCSFAQSSYNYNGSDINSNISVEAFNVNGQRIVTNVQIRLTSPNVKFTDNTTVKTVTTSSSGAVNVPIVVTGPGILNGEVNIAI